MYVCVRVRMCVLANGTCTHVYLKDLDSIPYSPLLIKFHIPLYLETRDNLKKEINFVYNCTVLVLTIRLVQVANHLNNLLSLASSFSYYILTLQKLQ